MKTTISPRWHFKAVLLVDDQKTGYKKGHKFDPKGFYYNGNRIVLVGSVKYDHAARISFPVSTVSVKAEFIAG